mmetsp:Transcript_30855/g.74564  ORF Transcript_30855/g.74564 Transcript_30855/m.74564 type:complete len:91 (+) Transcript_30855:707-979(+)
MKLAYKNLAVSAACMVLMNHTKMDLNLKCLDESSCDEVAHWMTIMTCRSLADRSLDRSMGSLVFGEALRLARLMQGTPQSPSTQIRLTHG